MPDDAARPDRCRRCGAAAGPDLAVVLTWVRDDDATGRSWMCPACARTHLRSIEARLDERWW